MARRRNGLWLTLAFVSELGVLAAHPAWAVALVVASLLGAVVGRPPGLRPAR